MAEIVRTNPWLAARHVKNKGKHAMVYDDATHPRDHPECFAVAGEDAGLHSGLTFRQVISGVKNRGFWSDVSVLKGDLDIYKGVERCGGPSGGNR